MLRLTYGILFVVAGTAVLTAPLNAQSCRQCDYAPIIPVCYLATEGAHFCDDTLPGTCTLIGGGCGGFAFAPTLLLDGSLKASTSKLIAVTREQDVDMEARGASYADLGLIRRECDGMVIARLYTAEMRAHFRRQVTELRFTSE